MQKNIFLLHLSNIFEKALVMQNEKWQKQFYQREKFFLDLSYLIWTSLISQNLLALIKNAFYAKPKILIEKVDHDRISMSAVPGATIFTYHSNTMVHWDKRVGMRVWLDWHTTLWGDTQYYHCLSPQPPRPAQNRDSLNKLRMKNNRNARSDESTGVWQLRPADRSTVNRARLCLVDTE